MSKSTTPHSATFLEKTSHNPPPCKGAELGALAEVDAAAKLETARRDAEDTAPEEDTVPKGDAVTKGDGVPEGDAVGALLDSPPRFPAAPTKT